MQHEFLFFRCGLGLILTVSVLDCVADEISAQDKRRHWRKDPVTYFVTLDGKLESLLGGLSRKPLKGTSSYANMLSHECQLDEIDCSEKQRAKLESKIQKSQRLEKQIRDLRKDNPYSQVNKSNIDKYLKQYLDIDRAISDLLLAHQKQRLKQVYLRWELASLGIPRAIGLNLIPIEPPVRKEQSQKILELCKSEKQKIDQKIASWKSSFVESLTKELSPQQQEKLYKIIPQKHLHEFVILSLERWRLEQPEKESKYDKGNRWNVLAESQQMFEIDFDFRLKKIENRDSRAVRTFQVLQMQVNSHVFSDLQLSKEQADIINKSIHEFMDFSKQHYKKTGEDLQSNGGVNYKKLRKQYLDGFAELSREKVLEFDANLSKPQSVVASRLLEQLTVTQFGLASWLLVNRAESSDIKMNKKQLERIRHQILSELDRISDESLEFEKRLNRSVIGILDKAQEECLKKMIGAPLKSGGGNPEIIAAQLRLNLDMIRRHLDE